MQHFDADAILGLDIVLWTHYLIKLLERGLIFGGRRRERNKRALVFHILKHMSVFCCNGAGSESERWKIRSWLWDRLISRKPLPVSPQQERENRIINLISFSEEKLTKESLQSGCLSAVGHLTKLYTVSVGHIWLRS